MSDVEGRAPGAPAGQVPGNMRVSLRELEQRLARRAADEHLVDVAYRTVDSPLGELLVAATERGVVRVAFASEDLDEVRTQLAGRVSPRILAAPWRLDAAARQLEEYFAGTRQEFALPLDHALSGGFRLEVQRSLPGIGYGTTASYRELAERLGRPRAVRAVGTACATNPHPILVPCHRVLRSDGSLGGYLGGLAAKTRLLELERGQAA